MFPVMSDISLNIGKVISTNAMPIIPASKIIVPYSIMKSARIPLTEDPHIRLNSNSLLRMLSRVINKDR